MVHIAARIDVPLAFWPRDILSGIIDAFLPFLPFAFWLIDISARCELSHWALNDGLRILDFVRQPRVSGFPCKLHGIGAVANQPAAEPLKSLNTTPPTTPTAPRCFLARP